MTNHLPNAPLWWTVARLLPLAGVLLALSVSPGLAADNVTVKKLDEDGKIRVEIGGTLFAEYVYKGYAKPIVYPIIGPGGIPMTRNYPMKKVDGEARDHPHHKSLWYTHGKVNGVDFWAEGPGRGKIVQDKLIKAAADGNRGLIHTTNKWVDAKGKVICTDTLLLTFSALPCGRVIDWVIELHASNGEVTLGDTKEGTMGIRTHPALRLRGDPKRGVKSANGKGVNSEGVRDKAMWGKRAKWVDYWGKIGEKTVGVAIFDHPSNPRHPTWWHARDYGLITANAFGVHDFERKPKGTGDLKIPAGKSVTFRFRFLFHKGSAEEADIAGLYKKYAATEPKPCPAKTDAAKKG